MTKIKPFSKPIHESVSFVPSNSNRTKKTTISKTGKRLAFPNSFHSPTSPFPPSDPFYSPCGSPRVQPFFHDSLAEIIESREFTFEIPTIQLPAENESSPRETLNEIPIVLSPGKDEDSPRESPNNNPPILSPSKSDDSPREVIRSLSADDWMELGQKDLQQIGVSFSKQLTAEISHCSQQLWELHDTLTAVISECIGVMVERMQAAHDRNLRDFYSRFILLNRLSLLDLSGEVANAQ